MDMQNDFGDLTNFLDFGDMDLGGGESAGNAQQTQSAAAAAAAAASAPGDFMLDAQFDIGAGDMLQQQLQMAGHDNGTGGFDEKSVFQQSMPRQFDVQQYQQQQQQQQQPFQQGHHGVPITPQSFEMHGETGTFLQRHNHGMGNHQHQMRKDDAIAFTPMASPVGTPQFNVQQQASEFTIPGAYFSPLTSPMIHAQQQQQQHQHQLQHQHQQQQHGFFNLANAAPGSHAPSPNEPHFDADLLASAMALPSPASAAVSTPAKRGRRKAATPRSAGASITAKSAPNATRQRKRKSGLASAETDGQSAALTTRSLPGSGGLSVPSHPISSSEADSVSPEPLSDASMAPPPRPDSASTQSPALTPQHNQHEVARKALAGGEAATPKSLLNGRNMPTTQSQLTQASSNTPTQSPGEAVLGNIAVLDDFALPEAAAVKSSRPALSRISTSTSIASGQQSTPRMSASRKTPKLGPDSTPNSVRPINSSATASPSTNAAFSPQSISTPGLLLKDATPGSTTIRPNSRSAAGSNAGRKRNSTSHNSISSPALLPKISPNIKPLLPEGTALHSPAHALLLASKSNYQNLLEGNRLPGVNYPDSLSTGLTSKRTSHKVAEQGRRNRINDALKEMQALLPCSANTLGSPSVGPKDGKGSASPGGEDDKDGKEGKGGGPSSSSKAATVESANEYIRKLQAENAALLLIKKEHEEMKRKLAGGPINAGKDDSDDSDETTKSSSTVTADGKEAGLSEEKNGDVVMVAAATAAAADEPEKDKATED
ncbi:hypothetical protein K431DRAFT_323038 [Polychaeton citri CBS 116435]|uniref:BHLH domain-containing protein n=1 Tax=Polychaeton citri CBS 116435 TaxID=1314669 RepID=A0A9P4Q0S3_9PEZI|nr:hypothetical protein K431DRAFT_323038 [Polychaeton citri CBS 116435]